jgi:hypothetical protein
MEILINAADICPTMQHVHHMLTCKRELTHVWIRQRRNKEYGAGFSQLTQKLVWGRFVKQEKNT